jgi:NADH-quinone oxidoreductase subunit M
LPKNYTEPLWFSEKHEWIQLDWGSWKLKIDYFLGLDGFNASIILLAAIVLWIGGLGFLEYSSENKGLFCFVFAFGYFCNGYIPCFGFFLVFCVFLNLCSCLCIS